MMCEYEVSRVASKNLDENPQKDATYLVRFMVWAYDEVNHNLKDDVLKSAIKAILYYMSKRYGVDPAECETVIDAKHS